MHFVHRNMHMTQSTRFDAQFSMELFADWQCARGKRASRLPPAT